METFCNLHIGVADNFLFLMVYHTMGFVLSWKLILHFKTEKLLHLLRYAVSFLFSHRFSKNISRVCHSLYPNGNVVKSFSRRYLVYTILYFLSSILWHSFLFLDNLDILRLFNVLTDSIFLVTTMSRIDEIMSSELFVFRLRIEETYCFAGHRRITPHPETVYLVVGPCQIEVFHGLPGLLDFMVQFNVVGPTSKKDVSLGKVDRWCPAKQHVPSSLHKKTSQNMFRPHQVSAGGY